MSGSQCERFRKGDGLPRLIAQGLVVLDVPIELAGAQNQFIQEGQAISAIRIELRVFSDFCGGKPGEKPRLPFAHDVVRNNKADLQWQDDFLIAAFAKLIPMLCQRMLHGGKRSEEHTSELQSLMRISYAV